MTNFVEVIETGGSFVEVLAGPAGGSVVEVIETSSLVEVFSPAASVVEVLSPGEGSVIDVLPSPGNVVEVLGEGGSVVEVLTGEGGVVVDMDAVVEDRVAVGNLSGHRVVVVTANSVSYADPMDLAHITKPMRLTTQSIMAGNEGEVLVLGEMSEPSWNWTPGAPLYVTNAGVLTQTPPSGTAWTRIIAYALSSTSIYFDPQPVIRL